ncbi:hypothetical protein DID88_004067 [Monilinia fructigena]|uniref:26S proteasome regulatory subunit RPN2 n=1 Tax=Monilinia fructigena TaxID=38457 RepID=A0A395IRP9_9HELO|nr:hypothetical protein DID88_004067 [Monilinia fructigena]
MPSLTSASGVLGFLSDEEPELKIFALQTLNDDIDTLWTEVAGSVSQIEALYEDESFPERQLASLVLAKVYIIYKHTMRRICSASHCATRKQARYCATYPATTFASGTNDANVAAALTSPTTPFSQSTLPSKSLLSRASTDNMLEQPVVQGKVAGSAMLPDRSTQIALQKVIERLFESCLSEGRYRQVVGIAVEARNLEVLRRVIKRASDDEKKSRSKKAEDTAGPAEELMEYVLDICMGVVQERGLRTEILRLILDLLNDIPTPDYFSIAKCVVYLDQDEEASTMLKRLVAKDDPTSTAIAYQIAFDLYDKRNTRIPRQATESDQLLGELNNQAGGSPESASDEHIKVYDSIRKILDGSETIRLNLEFLYRNNHTDLSILNKVRDSLEGRNSIFHTAVTFCNAFMNHGTTNDKFFRDNLEWLGKAVNWSKFSATAALGVIHRGNLSQAKRLLEPYLPRAAGVGGSLYSQGGALYAYGLIYANHGADALEYLNKAFNETQEEVIQHGGALGLGIAGMATGDEQIYANLKHVLYSDSALNGEAVGLAIGLIMLGTGNVKVLEDMILYCHDTQHEKSIRGLAIGMALIMYGRQEGADELIEGLLKDPDPTIRYGGIMTIALAYCGTGSNKAVRKLLHVAVSDVNDDVRRIAVMSLGFILFRKPGSVPRMVELLSESYNPHVRYGAAMALGISCAGTGLDEAIDLLEPMMKDPTDFNEVMNPKVAEIRKTLKKIVADRHEDAMAKFGCALALGIIDAGGRNCTIGLQTQTGNLNMAGIVVPLAQAFSTILQSKKPRLKMHQPLSQRQYSQPLLKPSVEPKRKSVLNAARVWISSNTPATPKIPASTDDKMDVDESTKDTDEKSAEKKDEGEKETPSETLKKKIEKEKVGYEIENMSRVLPAQLKFISFPAGRYKPVKKPTGGVIVLIDTKPEEEKVLIEEKGDMRTEALSVRRQADAQGEAVGAFSGAAAAAGVLTAVDEDEEGAEEATVPKEFDYFSDGDED